MVEVLVRSGKRTTSNALLGRASDLGEGHREAEPYTRGRGLGPKTRGGARVGTSNTTTEFRIFSALVVLIGAVVLGGVALDIYLHPPGPKQVGTATVEISGTARFRGEVGISGDTLTIEAKAPVSVEVPFARADYVVAQMEDPPGTLKIRVKDETVARSSGSLVAWDVPRDYRP